MALAHFRWLFVIARNSSFAYKGRAVDVKQVGRELGVRYVLEGSVRKAGNRIRISGQLIDAETGTHLWADGFEGPIEDMFDLQDHLTSSVIGAIAPKLQREEIKRARRKPPENLDAYDYYLRGLAKSRRWTKMRTPRRSSSFARRSNSTPDSLAHMGWPRGANPAQGEWWIAIPLRKSRKLSDGPESGRTRWQGSGCTVYGGICTRLVAESSTTQRLSWIEVWRTIPTSRKPGPPVPG